MGARHGGGSPCQLGGACWLAGWDDPTSLLNSLHTEPDEAGHCGALPLAQGIQAAPEHLVWERAALGQTGMREHWDLVGGKWDWERGIGTRRKC